ncbi:MAG TPA: S8 family serine peptidase, partial [Gammaproteobacteria bacterium]|nr:S8 family serine peptidase [Gammaproteobacteria bacterium]
MKPTDTSVWFALVLIGAVAPAAAQVTLAPLTEPLRLAAPVRPTKSGTAVYIVQLKDAGAANYKGGVSGFAATKPAAGQHIDRSSPAVDTYVKHIEQTHDRLLGEIGAPGSKLYSFRYTLNGFAAELSAAQVSRLAQRPEIERIWLDTDQQVQTNNSPIFLGLENQTGGLRADLKLRGEGVVIGIIDSGVAPNHPSLSDVVEHIPRACQSQWARSSWLGRWLCHSVRRNPPTQLVYEPPVDFRGACEVGDGFAAEACNNKLVGARSYIDGFLFRHELDPREFRSPKDADGHGTHVATVAAGNSVPARLFGTRVARISGIAPRARVAIYKACWLKPGEIRATCATSDLTRAIDDAVADGVDIINYSLGSLETDLTA